MAAKAAYFHKYQKTQKKQHLCLFTGEHTTYFCKLKLCPLKNTYLCS